MSYTEFNSVSGGYVPTHFATGRPAATGNSFYSPGVDCPTPNEIFPGTYAPCRSCEVDVSGELIPSWLVLILVIIGVLILLVGEYRAHDCVPGKNCSHSAPKPSPEDDNLEYVDKVKGMVKNNYDFVIWRQALLAGLVIPLPIIFFLKGRLPTLLEWFIVGVFVFFGTYATYSWIWAHFFYPNGQAIEIGLQELRDRLEANNNI